MRDVRALTVDRVGDLTGPCAPCLFWQTGPRGSAGANGHHGHHGQDGQDGQDGRDARAGSGDPDAAVLDRLAGWVSDVTDDWGPPGRVLYVDGRPVGQVLLAPARHVPRLATFATAPVDPGALVLLTVWADRTAARGLRKVLLQAAVKDALRHRVRTLDAIGARPLAVSHHPCVLESSLLERAGFRVEREHPAYPRMRLDLRTVVTLRDGAGRLLAGALAHLPRMHPVPSADPDGVTRARTAARD